MHTNSKRRYTQLARDFLVAPSKHKMMQNLTLAWRELRYVAAFGVAVRGGGCTCVHHH